MREPLVSIISPCYNGEEYLCRFFESILNQTYSNLELVFINDGSIDNTEEIVNSYQEKFVKCGIRFFYRYQENAGQAAALNWGLKLFSGEYLLWMDSDDEIMPEFIEKKVRFLQQNPEYVYCYGKAISVSEENPEKILKTYGKRRKTGEKDFFEDILYARDVFFSGYIVQTSALERVITNREIYDGVGGQNAQILLPLAWFYGEPGYVDDSVYKYYIRNDSHSHSQNTSEKVIRQLVDYEKILFETLDKIGDKKAIAYKSEVRKHYARLKFGNAVDSKKPKLIKKYYFELKQTGYVTWHERMLCTKYTNPYMRYIFSQK